MAGIVDGLFMKLGYEYDEENLEKFNQLAKGTGSLMKAGSIAAIGLATSFTLLFAKLSANALAQQRFAKTMDISRSSVEAFQRTSEELTGERGTADRFLSQFNNIQNELKAGIAPSENFLRSISMMGISLEEFQKLKPDEALLRLSQGFQSVDEDSQDAVTALLGLDTAGRNLFEGLTAERLRANTPAPADIAAIEKFDGLLRELKQTFNDAIVTFGTPLFEKLIPAISFLKDNMPAIIGFARQATDIFLALGVAIGESIGFAVITIEKLLEKADELGKIIGTGIFDAQESITGFFNNPLESLGFGGGSTTNNTNSSSKVSQNFNIEISSENPQAVAETIERHSREQMAQAQKSLTSGAAN